MAEERLTPHTPGWNRFGHQHLQRYQFAAAHIKGARVLDLACGVGYGSYVLRNYGAASVCGVDRCADAISYAHQHYRAPGLSYILGDALAWTPSADALFDVVVSFETIEHLPDPRGFLRHVRQLLRPGGLLLLSAPNALTHGRAHPPVVNPYHLNEPTYDQLMHWIGAEFEIESQWEQSPVVHENLGAELLPRASALLNSRWVRTADRIERALRRFLHKELPPYDNEQPPSGWMYRFTEVMPLLPERQERAFVYLVVCRNSR